MTRGSGAAGHMYAIVRIEVPTVVDDKQKALFAQLSEISNFDPRAHLAGEAA
jgi:DnaJ-class molecular chaperone